MYSGTVKQGDLSDFNKLQSRDKWDTWKEQVGTWHCSACGIELGDGPNRASPFHRASVHCGNCDAILTRRTGGGQLEPFRWELRLQQAQEKES